MRASTAAVLGNLEIFFATLIGVVVMREGTNLIAIVGNVVVFAGALLVAHGAARESTRPPPSADELQTSSSTAATAVSVSVPTMDLEFNDAALAAQKLDQGRGV